MKAKNGNGFLTVVLGVLFLTTVIMGMIIPHICRHEKTLRTVVKLATCTEEGQLDYICDECDFIVESKVVNAIGHYFINYELVIPPSVNKNGVEIGTCCICDSEKDEREFICPHEVSFTSIVVEPTCSSTGMELVICEYCGTTIAEHIIATIPCSYESWIYTKYATPFENGSRYKQCKHCYNTLSENYSMSMPGSNSIYIPGTGINAKLTVCDLGQSTVDAYDMVYGPSLLGHSGPFILGHNYGTMSKLHNTQVGQYLYLSINGSLETYKVVISEYALQNSSWTNIYGQTTGTSIFQNYDSKTLHMYTCYGGTNGRWIVLATLV